MKRLHPTQAKLLKLLKENQDNPLSMAALSSEASIEHASVLYHHLRQLEAKGYLTRNPANPKDYTISGTPEKPVVYINKYGMAQCGPEGIMLDDNIVDRIPIARSLLRIPVSDAFIVEARGDSMFPKIVEGDIVIGKRQDSAEHGDYIICAFQSKAMIKRLSTQNGITLLSLNYPKHEPISVTNPEDLRIAGIVKNIIQYSIE